MGTSSQASLHLMTFQPVADRSITARLILWPPEVVRRLDELGPGSPVARKWPTMARVLEDLHAFGTYSRVMKSLPHPAGKPAAMAIALGNPNGDLISNALGLLSDSPTGNVARSAADERIVSEALGILHDHLADGSCVEEVSFNLSGPVPGQQFPILTYDALALAISERLSGTASPLVDRSGRRQLLIPGPKGELMTLPCCPPAGKRRETDDWKSNLASLVLNVGVNDRPLSAGRTFVDVYPHVRRVLVAPFRERAYIKRNVSAYVLMWPTPNGAQGSWLRIPLSKPNGGEIDYDDDHAVVLYRALALGPEVLPPAQDLVRNPAAYGNAFLTFAEGLDSANKVFESGHHMRLGKGVPMVDRESLMESLSEALEGVLEPVEPIDRQERWPGDGRTVRLLNTVPAYPESGQTYRDQGNLDIATWDNLEEPYAPLKDDPKRSGAQALTRHRIQAAASVGGEKVPAILTVLLVSDAYAPHDSVDLKRLARPEIERLLGPSLDGEPEEGLCVTVREIRLPGLLYDPDKVNAYTDATPKELATQLRKYCDCKPTGLGSVSCALVMLPGHEWFSEVDRGYRYDPKSTIRAAFATLGVITQFVEPRNPQPTRREVACGVGRDLSVRVCSAVRSLLTDVGASNMPPSNGKAGERGCPVPRRAAFVSLVRKPRSQDKRVRRSRSEGIPISIPVAMVVDFERGTRTVVSPAFGPSGTFADRGQAMTYPQFLIGLSKFSSPQPSDGGERPGKRLADIEKHQLMEQTLEYCRAAIPPDGRRTILVFQGIGLGSYADFLKNVSGERFPAGDAVREFRETGRLRLGSNRGLDTSFLDNDPTRPFDACRIRLGTESEHVPTYFKDKKTGADGSEHYGEYSGAYLCPSWGVGYICNSTGKNDPTYKANALFADRGLEDGGAWQDSRVRALTEVLPYLRDPGTADTASWSAAALDLIVQVARMQNGSLGSYKDPLARPIGLLLLDEASKYVFVKQPIPRKGRKGDA